MTRAALLKAAKRVFAEHGIDGPLQAVAKEAGVGQGTLYRHFPDRMSLALAVCSENMEALQTLADDPNSTAEDLLALVTQQLVEMSALVQLAATTGARARNFALRLKKLLSSKRHPRFSNSEILLAISALSGLLQQTPPKDRAATAKAYWRLFAPR